MDYTVLEKEMATHSSILAWNIPWTEVPGGPQSMGLQRVGYDWTWAHTQYWSRLLEGTKIRTTLKSGYMESYSKGMVQTTSLITLWNGFPVSKTVDLRSADREDGGLSQCMYICNCVFLSVYVLNYMYLMPNENISDGLLLSCIFFNFTCKIVTIFQFKKRRTLKIN